MRVYPRGILLLQLGLLLLMLMASTFARADLELTAEERAWISSHQNVRIAIYPDYPPVSYQDKSGKLQGMVKDYLDRIQQDTGLYFSYYVPTIEQQASNDPDIKGADMVAFIADTNERRQYWLFTEPFLNLPLYLITRNNKSSNLKLSDLAEQKVSVVGHWASKRFLELNYSQIQIDSVKDTCEGMQHVAFGQSVAMFTDLPVASWCMRDLGLMNLKLAGKTEFTYELGISVRKDQPLFFNIMQKSLAQITSAEREEIYERWMGDSVFRQSWLEKNKQPLSIVGLILLSSITLLLYGWDSRMQARVFGLASAGFENNGDGFKAKDRYIYKRFVFPTLLFLLLLLVIYGLMISQFQWHTASDRWVLIALSIMLAVITLYSGYKLGSVTRTSLIEKLMQRLQTQTQVRQASEQQLEETALRLDKQNKAISRLSGILRDPSMTDEEKYRWLTELCAYTLDVDRVSLWMLMDDNNTLHMVDLFQQNLHRHSSGTRLYADYYPIYFNALATHRSIPVVDAMQDQITAEFRGNYLPENHIGAMLDSTVWFEGKVTGVLCIEHAETSRNWTMDEISFAGAVADQVQTLMESSRRKLLEHDLAYQQKHLETLVRARTAAIESNAKLARFLIEKAPVSIVYLNAALEILDANPEAQRLAGMKRDDVVGKNFLDLSRPEEREVQKAIFERVIHGEKIHGQRVSYKTIDGRVLELAVSRSMELDSDGNPVIISISQDVSQQKALEESLVRAREAAESADRIKSMFVASMSHELRTPLNSIIGFLGVVLQEMSGPINSVQKDQLSRAYQSAKHLLSLISDVIDISKIEAGFLAVHVESFPLKPVLREIESVVHHLVLEKHLDLSIQYDDNITLVTDRKRLYQVILNVVSNAVKYTEKGWVKVSTSVSGDWVNIIVQDTGIGMDENDIAKLFKPFVRLDSPLKIKTLGTGLGLYLTHKILTQLLQGKIIVESELERGSTFTISLPLKIEESAVDVHNGSVLEDRKP